MMDHDLKRADESACPAGAAGKVLPTAERVFVSVRLQLAMDEVESGVGDLRSLQNVVQYLCKALRASQRRLDRMDGKQ